MAIDLYIDKILLKTGGILAIILPHIDRNKEYIFFISINTYIAPLVEIKR